MRVGLRCQTGAFLSAVFCAVLFGSYIPATAQSLKQAYKLTEDANALSKQARSQEALLLFKQALAIVEKDRGSQHPDTARSLANIARCYWGMRDYAKALPLYERALAIREKALGPQHPETVTNLDDLASVYGNMCDYERALPLRERALANYEKALGPQDPETAGKMMALGATYRWMSDYAKALPLYERALAIREKALGPQHPDVAICLFNFAKIYQDMGDYAKALPLFERAFAIYEKAQPQREGPILNMRASVYRDMGNYAKALPLLEQALAICEKAYGSQSAYAAESLDNLGEVYLDMGDYAKALPLLERALEIREKALGPILLGNTASDATPLASVYQDMGDYAKALPLLEQALEIREKAYGPQHPGTAESLDNLGEVYRDMGDYAKALPLLERALETREKALGPQHPDTAATLQTLARFFYVMGNNSASRSHASNAIAAKHRQLQSILSLDERMRLKWQKENLSFWYACVLRPESLAQMLLRQKGVVLDSLMEDGSLAASAIKDPDGAAKFAEITKLRAELAGLVFDSKCNAEAAKLQEQIGQLQRSLSTRASVGGRVRAGADITIDAIVPALANGSTLVDLIQFGDPKLKGAKAKCYGAVITGADGTPGFVRIDGGAEIDRAVDSLRGAINNGNQKETEVQTQFLSEKLWQPIASKIPPGTKQLILCPDANLNFLSFATLLESDGQFVAEKYPITYVGSGRDLARKPSGETSKSIAVFAAPTFDATGDASPANEMVALRSAEADVFGTISLPSLPGTKAEAQAIETLAKQSGWEACVATGDEATESSVRNTKKPGILHLATHGFYLNSFVPAGDDGTRGMSIVGLNNIEEKKQKENGVDPMRASGVALSGAQQTLKLWSQRKAPDPETDGILTAEEVASLNLDGTWLVTLSACETGVGEARSGEGVFGLRRAFMMAGAENLLMTLWPVADDTTASIMADFYKEALVTGDAPASLAKVQRDWLVKLREEKGLAAAIREAGPFAMVMMTAPTHPPVELPPIAKLESKDGSKSESATQPTDGSTAEKKSSWWPF